MNRNTNSGEFIDFVIKTIDMDLNEKNEVGKYFENNKQSIRIDGVTIDIYNYIETIFGIFFRIAIYDLIKVHRFLIKNFNDISGFVLMEIVDVYGASMDRFNINFIQKLIEGNHIDIIDYLIDNNYYPKFDYLIVPEYNPNFDFECFICCLDNEVDMSSLGLLFLEYSVKMDGIMLEYLLDKFDILAINTNGNAIINIILEACKNGDIGSTQLMFNQFKNIVGNSKQLHVRAMINSIQSGVLNLVKFWMINVVNIMEGKKYYLIQALKFGNMHIAEYLVENGIDITSISVKDIEHLIDENSIESLHWLLPRLKFNRDQINYLFVNSFVNDVEMVEFLIDQGASVKHYGKILRDQANEVNNKELVAYLNKIMTNHSQKAKMSYLRKK